MRHLQPALLLCVLPGLQDPAPAELLPADALAVVEAPDLGATVRNLLASEPWRRVQEGPLGAALVREVDFQKFLLGLRFLEGNAGAEPLELLEALAGNGAALALLPSDGKQNWLAVFRAPDPDLAQDGINALLSLATQGAAQVDGTSWRLPLPKGPVIQRREGLFFLASAATALDGLAPDRKASIAAIASFEAGRKRLPDADLRFWVGAPVMQLLRASLPEGRTEDPGGSLFLGAPAAAGALADWAVAGLAVGQKDLVATLETPAQDDALRGDFAPLFPPSQAVEMPRVDGELATMVLAVDPGPWWTGRDRFLTPLGMADSVEPDGTFSTIFQRDFGTQLLAHLEPELRFVVARAEFPGSRPEVEFPAGALGLRARTGKKSDLSAAFYNAFSLLISITNFESGGMGDEGLTMQEPVLLEGGTKIYSAHYKQLAADLAAPSRYNLSPALVLGADGEIWISSSSTLARALAESPRDRVQLEQARMRATLAPGRQILRADDGALLANQVLENGGDLDAARKNVDLFHAAAGLFDHLALDAQLDGGFYRVRLALENQGE